VLMKDGLNQLREAFPGKRLVVADF
jgi:hypothetical protein